MRETIQPSPDEECCCCRTSGVLLHVFEDGFAERKREHWHCEICYRTLIGNTCVYRSVHSDAEVQQAIAACTNIILKALNK